MHITSFQNIWEFLINFFEIVLFYIFIKEKLSLRKRTPLSYTALFSFLGVQVVTIYFLNQNSVSSFFTIIFSLIVNVIFTVLFFKGSFIFCLYCGIFFSIICLFSEYLALLIPQFLPSFAVEKILPGGSLRVPFSALYIAFIAVFVFLSLNIMGNNIYMSSMQKIVYTALALIGIVISHYILIVTFSLSQTSLAEEFTNKLILINLCFLMLFLALLIYIYQLGKSKEQNLIFLEKEKQHALEVQQYQILLETTESLRKMKHDIKIHLDVMQTLSEQNRLSELQEYLCSYNQSLETTHYLLSTGNTAIDCVLSNKLSYAKQCGIKMEYSVITPSTFPLDSIALSSLLGNILNNAIEACLRYSEKKADTAPWIKFYIKPFQNMMLIHSENCYMGNIETDSNQNFLSVKNEKEHGIGIQRIKDIVNDVGGIFQFNTDNHIFTVHIMIPLKETIDES